jgi:NAD(P)-dependent dehydrogenase (short-subunit alcohol dehydrogenase family)
MDCHWNFEKGSRGRHPLKKLANTTCYVMDVDDQKSVTACANDVGAALNGAGIQLLVNNAGIAIDVVGENRVSTAQADSILNDPAASKAVLDLPSEVTPANMLGIFRTNVIGVLMVTQAFLPLLKPFPRDSSIPPMVLNMSSGAGSIGDNTSGKMTSYRVSKAALNMLTRNFALERKDIVFLSIAPGMVITDMGTMGHRIVMPPKAGEEYKPVGLTADQSAQMMHENVISKHFNVRDSGKFYVFRGNEFPW